MRVCVDDDDDHDDDDSHTTSARQHEFCLRRGNALLQSYLQRARLSPVAELPTAGPRATDDDDGRVNRIVAASEGEEEEDDDDGHEYE